MATDYDFVFEAKKEAEESSSTFNTILYVAFITLVAVTAFLIGVMFERRANTAATEELSTFWQVWDILDERYYGELPTVTERKYGAINGLVASLDDPFTTFAEPELAAVQRQQIDGHFGGVGIVVRTNENGNVGVVSVIPGNPADQAGIQAGDVFIEVDGKNVEGFTTEQVANLVRGEVGTSVDLVMYRPDEDQEFEFSVERAIIETPTVYSENMDGIGYARLSTFNGVAMSQMQEHITDLQSQDVEALIIDLRGNGGGLLEQSIDIADLFLEEGVVLIQRSSDGTEDVFHSATGDIAEEIPMVVLVDRGTASAAEVVAGALQDRDRAILVGQQTFGKGVVQLVYNLDDGSQLRVTSSAWYTPNDEAINESGLTPDLPVEQTFSTQGDDLVVEAALEYLNDQLGVEDEE